LIGRLLTALALLSASAVASSPSSHERWARAALDRLPVFGEDRDAAEAKSAQLNAIAAAIAYESKRQTIRPPREWAALLTSIGFHESTFSLRIHRGECNLLKRECDAAKKNGQLYARAKSPWQLHENKLNRDSWPFMTGIENTDLQVLEASAALQRGHWTCSRSGVPWLVGTINGFAGRMCSAKWPGLEARLATFNRVLATPTPAGAGS
jgi:hypothetical protein